MNSIKRERGPCLQLHGHKGLIQVLSLLLLLSAPSLGCQKAVDVALVVDVSGSVTKANFRKVIQFLKLFVNRFDFPDSATRLVGVLSAAWNKQLPCQHKR